MRIAYGCAAPKRLRAVPPSLQYDAHIKGMTVVRYWSGQSTDFLKDGMESFQMEKKYLEESGHKGPLPTAEFLAISGGGDNGAFGAGLLLGWTKADNRPEFNAVTGISTGALIAPFAFFGPDYDNQLKKVYTDVSPGDIMKRRNIISAIFKDAMAETHLFLPRSRNI